jgi:hypothetical protein
MSSRQDEGFGDISGCASCNNESTTDECTEVLTLDEVDGVHATLIPCIKSSSSHSAELSRNELELAEAMSDCEDGGDTDMRELASGDVDSCVATDGRNGAKPLLERPEPLVVIASRGTLVPASTALDEPGGRTKNSENGSWLSRANRISCKL